MSFNDASALDIDSTLEVSMLATIAAASVSILSPYFYEDFWIPAVNFDEFINFDVVLLLLFVTFWEVLFAE